MAQLPRLLALRLGCRGARRQRRNVLCFAFRSCAAFSPLREVLEGMFAAVTMWPRRFCRGEKARKRLNGNLWRNFRASSPCVWAVRRARRRRESVLCFAFRSCAAFSPLREVLEGMFAAVTMWQPNLG
ncbi:MAG: hypothetical protein IPL28_25360 [Chloroflexi bacterium]|nr:hypothetical protein [Chloroflexota bacterium]